MPRCRAVSRRAPRVWVTKKGESRGSLLLDPGVLVCVAHRHGCQDQERHEDRENHDEHPDADENVREDETPLREGMPALTGGFELLQCNVPGDDACNREDEREDQRDDRERVGRGSLSDDWLSRRCGRRGRFRSLILGR